MRHAVFLDRDGTLIKDVGFLSDLSEIYIYPFVFEALKILQERFDLFIVTNQCGIAEGAIDRNDVDMVNTSIIDTLRASDIDIKECYVCPHAIGAACKCRKPKPYFAELAAEKYKIDLSGSYAIGDHLSDIRFAEEFGGKGAYVLTGHGSHHYSSVPDNVCISRNLLYAARKILSSKL